MSLEPQAGAQNGLPVENPTSIISIGERSLMDVWRVLMKQRLIIVAVTLLSLCRGSLARVSHAAGLSNLFAHRNQAEFRG
jgi:hypothetical protein